MCESTPWDYFRIFGIFGEKSDCGNFRGISLLSIVGKVFARVLSNRLISGVANDVLPEGNK